MLKVLFVVLVSVIAAFVILLTFVLTQQDKDHITVKYDCRMLQGNWHPDFPAVVLAECKKRNFSEN
jgi:hypothetical protein